MKPLSTSLPKKTNKRQLRAAIAIAHTNAIIERSLGRYDQANHWASIAHGYEHNQACWWKVAGGALTSA